MGETFLWAAIAEWREGSHGTKERWGIQCHREGRDACDHHGPVVSRWRQPQGLFLWRPKFGGRVALSWVPYYKWEAFLHPVERENRECFLWAPTMLEGLCWVLFNIIYLLYTPDMQGSLFSWSSIWQVRKLSYKLSSDSNSIIPISLELAFNPKASVGSLCHLTGPSPCGQDCRVDW